MDEALDQMSKKRTYTGTKDGAASGKRAGTEELQRLLCKRFNARNLGTWVVRNMRGKNTLSVHATGRAGDTMPKNRKDALAIVAWLETHAELLDIEEIHDYLYDIDGDGPAVGYGRGWRVGRGWKVWTAKDNGGPGGLWIHWEVGPRLADDAKAMRRAWLTAKRIAGE
jgi:hypothetical protein